MENNKFKIIHFSEEFSLNEINNYLAENIDILYYTRTLKENTEIHIVKCVDDAFFKLSTLISELIKMYNKNVEINKLIKNIKIKGNDKFIIIENINLNFINKLKNDLNKLLIK